MQGSKDRVCAAPQACESLAMASKVRGVVYDFLGFGAKARGNHYEHQPSVTFHRIEEHQLARSTQSQTSGKEKAAGGRNSKLRAQSLILD